MRASCFFGIRRHRTQSRMIAVLTTGAVELPPAPRLYNRAAQVATQPDATARAGTSFLRSLRPARVFRKATNENIKPSDIPSGYLEHGGTSARRMNRERIARQLHQEGPGALDELRRCVSAGRASSSNAARFGATPKSSRIVPDCAPTRTVRRIATCSAEPLGSLLRGERETDLPACDSILRRRS